MTIEIMKIYKESFENVRSHKREWVRVAGGPLIVWAAGAFLLLLAYIAGGHSLDISGAFMGGTYFQTGGTSPQEAGENSPMLLIAHAIYSIAYFVAITSLYINGYRYAVLGEGGDGSMHLNLNMRFVKMVLYMILLGILSAIYLAVSAGIIIGSHALFSNTALNVVLGILLALYGFYLLLRILLYPVLISVDQGEPLKTSWRLMKGNILRFIGLTFLIGLTILVIGIVIGAILGLLSFLLAMISPTLGVASLVLWFLFAIFMILFGWAVNSKAMGLVYLTLSPAKKES